MSSLTTPATAQERALATAFASRVRELRHARRLSHNELLGDLLVVTERYSKANRRRPRRELSRRANRTGRSTRLLSKLGARESGPPPISADAIPA